MCVCMCVCVCVCVLSWIWNINITKGKSWAFMPQSASSLTSDYEHHGKLQLTLGLTVKSYCCTHGNTPKHTDTHTPRHTNTHTLLLYSSVWFGSKTLTPTPVIWRDAVEQKLGNVPVWANFLYDIRGCSNCSQFGAFATFHRYFFLLFVWMYFLLCLLFYFHLTFYVFFPMLFYVIIY